MRTTLESGAWIEHVPIQDIKGRHIRDYERAGKPRVGAEAFDDDGKFDRQAVLRDFDLGRSQEQKQDAVWAIVISAWSYEFPVPVFDRGSGETKGADSFEEIPGDDYREIERLIEPFTKKLAARPDPKGAITSASNGSSRAKASGSHPG